MATSGTVGQQLVSVDTLITHAIQKCGKLPSTAGGELLQRVREALYFLIADLGNDGINLWCMTKSVVNVVPYNISYQLPVATQDVPEALYRSLQVLPGIPAQTVDAVTIDLGSAIAVNNIDGIFDTAGDILLVIEYSFDGINWIVLQTLNPATVGAGARFVMDLDNSAPAQFWRIRDSSGTLLPMSEVQFRTIFNEILMAKLNRDDYTNLPNKHTRGQRALQFWFDKQIEPRVFVWPMPTTPGDQFVFWAVSQVQDPGNLTNELAVPTRWYRSIAASLAHMTAFLIPPSELPPGRLAELKADADEAKTRASNGESDGSPWQLAPLIGGYTK